MKKLSIILIVLFIIPIVTHAETLTYSVCTGGGDFDRCDYSNLEALARHINSLENLSDKDIIVNINSETNYNDFYVGSEENIIKSLTINANNHEINTIDAHVDAFEINDANMQYQSIIYNGKKIKVNSTSASMIGIFYINNEKVSRDNIYLNDILEIDEESLNSVDAIYLAGNIKIENMNFKNILIENAGGTLNIYNSQLSKVLSGGVTLETGETNTNIYNSTFDSLRYLEITSIDKFMNEFSAFINNQFNISDFRYDIYDVNMSVDGGEMHGTTTIYFDKNLGIKSNGTIDLTSYLDYYTDDKETNYTIEDESIAKIEGLNLTGLNEGQTNITVTTDDGHVVYRIKLNVIKEIEIPLSGINVKPWVLIVGIILLGVIGFCIYLLIKTKKVSK